MRYDIVITSDLMNRVQHIIYIQFILLFISRSQIKIFHGHSTFPAHSEIFKRCKGYRFIQLITSFEERIFLRTKSSVANHFLANDINPVVTLRAPEESSCLYCCSFVLHLFDITGGCMLFVRCCSIHATHHTLSNLIPSLFFSIN